jgi:hypothetical protein
MAKIKTTRNFQSSNVQSQWAIEWEVEPGTQVEMSLGGWGPIDTAATFEKIGHDVNAGATVGPQYFATNNFRGALDGYHLQHRIFANGTISYGGGAVDVRDVYFVNCTFKISRQAAGQNFARAILMASPATNFRN